MKRTISINVVRRLPGYLRLMEKLLRDGIDLISSSEIAKITGQTPSQIRQDFSHYGTFGTQGYGYDVRQVRDELLKILGVNRCYKVILIGAGKLGMAILENFDYIFKGYTIEAAFDNDPKKIGKTIGGAPILDVSHLEKYLEKNTADIAILTVPRNQAQGIADRLEPGCHRKSVRAIWNFAGAEIKTSLLSETIHFSDSLLVLTYMLNEMDNAELEERAV